MSRVCYLSNGKSSVDIKLGQFRELDGMVELFDHALKLFWKLLQLMEGMLRDLSVVPPLLSEIRKTFDAKIRCSE